MNWFFKDEAAVQRLRTAATAGDGTPFREHSCAIGAGGGIDCIGWCEHLMVAAGVVQPGAFAFARTDADYQSHRTWLRILHYLRGEVTDDPQSARLAAIFAEIKLPQIEAGETENLYPGLFMPGDLLMLRDEGQIHLPVMLRGRRFTHCMRPDGVTEGNLHDTTFSKMIVAVFRARAVPLGQTTARKRQPTKRGRVRRNRSVASA